MIPAFPMDGGRVLRALLALRMGEVRATEIAAGIGQMLAIAGGFVALMSGHLLGLFVAFFVFVGAGQEAAMYRGKALVEGLPVQAAMITDFRTLAVGASLRQAAELLLQTSQQDFPVVHGEEVVGVLPRSSLLRGLAESGPDAYVSEAMSREFLAVQPERNLEEIASEMQSGQNPVVLVMRDQELLGIVTLENLAELLIVRQLTQKAQESRS
jgi:CBS domain-containing protein